MKQGIVKSEGSNMRLGFSFLGRGGRKKRKMFYPDRFSRRMSSERNLFEAFIYFWVLDLMIIPRGSHDSKFDPC